MSKKFTKDDFKRERLKIGTQARLAALMGVHIQSVIQWETGARPIPPARFEEVRRLAKNPPPPDGTFKLDVYVPETTGAMIANAGSSERWTLPALTPEKASVVRAFLESVGGKKEEKK